MTPLTYSYSKKRRGLIFGHYPKALTTLSKMANLSQAEAINLIRSPRNRGEIVKARAKKLRHSLHTETQTDDCVTTDSHAKFLAWAKSMIDSEDNFKRFLSIYRPPIPTNEFTQSIFSQFQKIFESENAFEQIEFKNPEVESDFSEYRKRIGDFSFWETQGFEALKNSIDNVVVIDLPQLQKDAAGNYLQQTEYPEPYYYLLDINHLIDIENTKFRSGTSEKGFFYYFKTEYIIFRESAEEVCVFDDTFYRKYKYDENATIPVLISESEHRLGYCPARSFWTTPLNSKSNICKLSPITNSLSELDWLLFYETCAKYLKLYAPFPIYAVYKGICNYKDQANKKRCIDGFLYPMTTDPKAFNYNQSDEPCPRCKNKIKTGPGNVLELKAPQSKEDPDLLTNPIKVIPAEETSIATVNEEIRTKTEQIYLNCVGAGGDPKNDQAKNETQIRSGFESKTNVLLNVKRNFEIIHSFVVETLARLRYGDNFISANINYGDRFFSVDEAEELQDYKVAKDSGLPSIDLAMRRDKINYARYKNEPDQFERYNILKNLDPFPDSPVADVVELSKSVPGAVDEAELILKVNFNRFISRFEREQADVLQFARAAQFDKKINTIYEVLLSYANEVIAKKALNPTPPAPAPVPAPVV